MANCSQQYIQIQRKAEFTDQSFRFKLHISVNLKRLQQKSGICFDLPIWYGFDSG